MLYKQISSPRVKNGRNGRHRRRSARRHFRDGQRAAVLRAITAGRNYLGRPVSASTLAEAAAQCSSGIGYVEATVTLLEFGTENLIDQALARDVPLLKAAALVRRQCDLLQAVQRVRNASRADWAHVGRALGPDEILEFAIAAEAAE